MALVQTGSRKVNIERQGQCVILSGDLRHTDAAPLAAILADALADGDLRVTDRGVTDAGFGVLQVLVAAAATARDMARNLHLDLAERSALRATARLAGMAL
jgi:hypothetical protein